jgi:hypothetical protein
LYLDHRLAAFSIATRLIASLGRSANLRYSAIDNLVSTTYERGNGKCKKAKINKQTFWCIRADVVRKLDHGEPEPETLASGSTDSSEELDASDPAPF